jgi:hydroxymethylpyrimidine pyrophosphatase-like HAD family hydrolase
MGEIPAMTGHSGWALCANGALTLDLETQEIIHADLMDPELGLEMAKRLTELDPEMAFAVELAIPNNDFVMDANYRPRWETTTPALRMSLAEMFDTGKVVKLLARPSSSLQGMNADAFLHAAEELADGIAEITHSDINDLMIECSLLGVNKGTGLAALASQRGISVEQVTAVGDMPNDVPMVKWAGLGCAVANAHDWVFAVADQVLPSNDDHGVAVLIDQILNNK